MDYNYCIINMIKDRMHMRIVMKKVSTPNTANENVLAQEPKVEVSKSDDTNEKPTDENPKPFVDFLEYAKVKVGRDMDENSTAAGRVLPITLKKFFRSNSE